MISAKKEKMLFSSLEKGGRYGTRKLGTHHLRLPYGGSRLPRPVCLQGLQVILLHLPGAGILMSILRELFRKFPFFFARFLVGQASDTGGGVLSTRISPDLKFSPPPKSGNLSLLTLIPACPESVSATAGGSVRTHLH